MSVFDQFLPSANTPNQSSSGNVFDQFLPQTPQDVRNAEEVTGSHDFDGWCESFVEQQAGLPNMGRTAAEAFQNWNAEGKAYQDPNVEQAPAGALIYFQPDQSNQYSGHVGIADGQGNIVSATYQGVRQDNITNWMNATGQKPLGYVIP